MSPVKSLWLDAVGSHRGLAHDAADKAVVMPELQGLVCSVDAWDEQWAAVLRARAAAWLGVHLELPLPGMAPRAWLASAVHLRTLSLHNALFVVDSTQAHDRLDYVNVKWLPVGLQALDATASSWQPGALQAALARCRQLSELCLQKSEGDISAVAYWADMAPVQPGQGRSLDLRGAADTPVPGSEDRGLHRAMTCSAFSAWSACLDKLLMARPFVLSAADICATAAAGDACPSLREVELTVELPRAQPSVLLVAVLRALGAWLPNVARAAISFVLAGRSAGRVDGLVASEILLFPGTAPCPWPEAHLTWSIPDEPVDIAELLAGDVLAARQVTCTAELLTVGRLATDGALVESLALRGGGEVLSITLGRFLALLPNLHALDVSAVRFTARAGAAARPAAAHSSSTWAHLHSDEDTSASSDDEDLSPNSEPGEALRPPADAQFWAANPLVLAPAHTPQNPASLRSWLAACPPASGPVHVYTPLDADALAPIPSEYMVHAPSELS